MSFDHRNIASCSSSSWCLGHWIYHVFLSFYGKDTRKNFVDHLFATLEQRGVKTFRDDKSLTKGEEMTPELLKAIEGSRFVIIVFSKNYPASSWCLIELVKIMECKEMTGMVVYPVFYDVKPSEVWKLETCFGEAIAKHEVKYKKEVLEVWKSSLVEAGRINGRDVKETANGYESECIKEIVENILSHLDPTISPQKSDDVKESNTFGNIETSRKAKGHQKCFGVSDLLTSKTKVHNYRDPKIDVPALTPREKGDKLGSKAEIGEQFYDSIFLAILPDKKVAAVKKNCDAKSESNRKFLKLVSKCTRMRHENLIVQRGYYTCTKNNLLLHTEASRLAMCLCLKT